MHARLRYGLIVALIAGWFGTSSPRAAATTLSADSAPQAAPGPNVTHPALILVIGMDTVRADHLPAYGYFRDTTPNVDAFVGAQGVVFSDTTSAASWTFPAGAAILTGLRPFRLGLGWDMYAHPVPASATTLAEYLQAAGYHTAGFVANSFVSGAVGLDQGFDDFDVTPLACPHTDACAQILTDRVISWTQQLTRTEPLFIFAWYLDPHTWYNPPPPYDLLYDPVYTGTVTPATFGDGFGRVIQSPRDLEHLEALYDGDIRFTDEQVGRLFSYLDGRGLLDDALIVVGSDHGEQFGEHGRWVHGDTIYEELLRVPLWIRYPAQIAPARIVTAPVETLDILPTILDYAGLPIPPGLDGTSLRPWLSGDPPPGTRPIYAEIEAMVDPTHWGYGSAPMVDLRSLRLGDWKYIHHVTAGWDDELYHLNAAAQYEAGNLLQAEPARAAAMLRQIRQYYSLNLAYLPALVRGVP